MDKKLSSTIENLIIRWNIDGHKTAGHLTRQIMEEIENVTLNSYKILEDNGVYIHFATEHYTDGSNLCFSIEFTNYNTQTIWYNDDHEFGDVEQTTSKSIKLALWYLEDPRRIEFINGISVDPEYMNYFHELSNFLKQILIVE